MQERSLENFAFLIIMMNLCVIVKCAVFYHSLRSLRCNVIVIGDCFVCLRKLQPNACIDLEPSTPIFLLDHVWPYWIMFYHIGLYWIIPSMPTLCNVILYCTLEYPNMIAKNSENVHHNLRWSHHLHNFRKLYLFWMWSQVKTLISWAWDLWNFWVVLH